MGSQPTITNVSSKYGAPMGRRSGTLEGKVHLYRVVLGQDGYDRGGAYWGRGEPLYCAYDNEHNAVYLRATSREVAKRKLVADSPNLSFYR